MASALSLPDDCLHRLISYIDDQSSFLSFTLTCQRFAQVAESTRSALHTKLLQAKAEYYIKRYVVEIGDDYRKLSKLEGLLFDTARLARAKGMVTFDKVIDVWHKNGPVAAKLLTWILNQESSREEGEPRATCYTEKRSLTLHLPSCKKNVMIETSFFEDCNGIYDPEISIHVFCGELDVKSNDFSRNAPVDYMHWEEEEVKDAVEPMKEAIALLQKELGETVPPITAHFFIWLCFFFPYKDTLVEQHRLNFKDSAKNTTPSHASVQPAIDQFLKNQEIEKNLEKLMTGWETVGNQPESKYSTMIAASVRLLAQRSEARMLQRLQSDAGRFYNIATDCDLKKIPKRLLLYFILHTSLEESDYCASSIVDKCIANKVFFKCHSGKILTVSGWMHGDGAGLPSWLEVKLQFTLPDGTVIKLQAGHKPLKTEKLNPVTELLEESMIQSLGGDQVPKVGNLFTAAYFLCALEFESSFLGRSRNYKLIPSESEEESEKSD